MADTALNAATFPTNATYQQYYEAVRAANQQAPIDYNRVSVGEQTYNSIADQVSASLKPYYDMAARQRQKSTQTNVAELAADAYSRGMGSSTWLSDMNSRQYSAEAADLANIEAQRATAVGSSATSQYQNFTQNKLNADLANASNALEVSKYNTELKRIADELAYQRLIDAYNMGAFYVPSSDSSGGSIGSGGSGSSSTNDLTLDSVNAWASYSPPRSGSALTTPGNAPLVLNPPKSSSYQTPIVQPKSRKKQ